jgi:RHS repeat-associated protein
LARIDSSGNAAWYVTDIRGSVRDVANYAGTMVLDHLDYDGYGIVTNETVPASGDRYKYTGREFDPVTALQYNRARYYDPKTGRWTSQDPLGLGAGDENLYRYVRNDPTGQVDAYGYTELGLDQKLVESQGEPQTPLDKYGGGKVTVPGQKEPGTLKFYPAAMVKWPSIPPKTASIEYQGPGADCIHFIQFFYIKVYLKKNDDTLVGYNYKGEINTVAGKVKVSFGRNVYTYADQVLEYKDPLVWPVTRGKDVVRFYDPPQVSVAVARAVNDEVKDDNGVKAIIVKTYFDTFLLALKKIFYRVSWISEVNMERGKPDKFELDYTGWQGGPETDITQDEHDAFEKRFPDQTDVEFPGG